MKKIDNKIKELMNNYPKMFVLILVIILIIVMFLIYRIADKYMNYSKVIEEDIYTYIGQKKYDLKSKMIMSNDGVINDIKPALNINWSTSPIYSKSKVIIPYDMVLILPKEEYAQYRVNTYTYIKKGKFVTNGFNGVMDKYFLYDGYDTYILGEDSKLYLDGKEIELSKYSYIICDDTNITYYDYDKDKIVMESTPNSAILKNIYYEIDLKEDTVGRDKYILPGGIENIEHLKMYKKN